MLISIFDYAIGYCKTRAIIPQWLIQGQQHPSGR